MAVRQITYFLVGLFLKQMRDTWAFEMKSSEIKGNLTMRSHLKYQSVLYYCMHRNETCKSNTTNVCAIKIVNQRRFYQNFGNGCFLFMSNMCDHPEEEYFIISSGSCEDYLASRRTEEEQTIEASAAETEAGETTTAASDVTENETESNTDTTVNEETTTQKYNSTRRRNTTAHVLRAFSYSPLYEVEYSHDGHPCPMSCPDVYQPVCVNINRGSGKYFKLLYFINHCVSDKYYCGNWREFIPPPGDDTYQIRASILGWSFCAAHRYIQFARYSEVISSMGSYGWLSGNYRYSHIMAPHQVKPGFG